MDFVLITLFPWIMKNSEKSDVDILFQENKINLWKTIHKI